MKKYNITKIAFLSLAGIAISATSASAMMVITDGPTGIRDTIMTASSTPGTGGGTRTDGEYTPSGIFIPFNTVTGPTKPVVKPAPGTAPLVDEGLMEAPVPGAKPKPRPTPTPAPRTQGGSPEATVSNMPTPAPITTGQTSQTNDRPLRVGTTGDDVSALQTKLESLGILVLPPVSGKGFYGPRTRKAVMEYQRSKNIPATGFFGPLTRAALSLEK